MFSALNVQISADSCTKLGECALNVLGLESNFKVTERKVPPLRKDFHSRMLFFIWQDIADSAKNW